MRLWEAIALSIKEDGDEEGNWGGEAGKDLEESGESACEDDEEEPGKED